MKFAERVYSLTQKQKNPALTMGGYVDLVVTHYFLGEFETGRQYTTRGLQILQSGGVQTPVEEVDVPAVSILSFEAIFQWHLGEIISCHTTMPQAISLAKELNDMHGLAVALRHAVSLAYYSAVFGRGDVSAIGQHCNVPFVVISSQEVKVLPTMSEIEAYYGGIQRDLRERGYSHSTPSELHDQTRALASAVFVRHKTDGSELETIGATYVLRKP
jgi:hypothetical protein